jgi:hypothetical protein
MNMTQFAAPLTGFGPVISEQRGSRLRRYGRTLLWLCLTSAIVAAIVLFGPHIFHVIHPGPTGGGG